MVMERIHPWSNHYWRRCLQVWRFYSIGRSLRVSWGHQYQVKWCWNRQLGRWIETCACCIGLWSHWRWEFTLERFCEKVFSWNWNYLGAICLWMDRKKKWIHFGWTWVGIPKEKLHWVFQEWDWGQINQRNQTTLRSKWNHEPI